jgi:hypothetical protein
MSEQYFKLFSLIAHTGANIAEQVMEQNKKEGKVNEYKTSKKMRDDYLELKTKMDNKEAPIETDFSQLYIAAGLVVQQLEAKLAKDQLVIKAYREDMMPKLLECMKGGNVNEIFTVEN